MRNIPESVLLTTSSNTDVQCSGGNIAITGLKTIRKNSVTSIQQIKYRAAVAQVATVGAVSYTPTGATKYSVSIYDPNRVRDGYQESPFVFSYTTPSNILQIGATAALQREAITVAILAKIALNSVIHVTGATLGSGTGFTITDNVDYYPVYSQSMTNEKFVSTILAETNPDGSGFLSSNVSITTAGVVSSGVGAKLNTMGPVVDQMNAGNLIQGVIDAPPATPTNPPTYAVSGQNYDSFVILCLKSVTAHNVTGQLAYVPHNITIWVDNGTGSSTTNLAGFLTFQREMRKLAIQLYSTDAQSAQQWFDQDFTEQGLLGAAPATTAGVANKFETPYGILNHFNIGTQTIVTGTQANAGLLIDQDATATEGAAYVVPLWTNNSQQFVVGKTAMTMNCRVSFTTPANVVFMAGFRTKEAHQAAFASYQYLATVGLSASGTTFVTYGNLAAGTPVVTANGNSALTTIVYDYRVQIGIDGVVTCYANNVKSAVYSLGTTALVIPASQIMVPFFQFTNLNSAAQVGTISEFWAVPTDLVIS